MTSTETTPLSEQAVYEATKDIFIGPKAKFRQIKLVKKCIKKAQRNNEGLKDFLDVHGSEAVCELIQKLLSKGVFESAVYASSYFPWLFEPSSAQNAAIQTVEDQAIEREESVIQEAIEEERAEEDRCIIYMDESRPEKIPKAWASKSI